MFDLVAPPVTSPARAVGWVVPGVERERPVELPVELPASVQDLVAAVSQVGGQDLVGLGDAEVLATTRALLVQAQRLELVATAALAEVDRRRAYRLDGASSTGRWVEGQGLSAGRDQVGVARRLGAFPQVDAAVLSGALSLGCAQKLQVALGRLRPHLDRPDGLIDGWDGEQVLGSTLLDGVRMVVAEARGGFVAHQDPALVGLLQDLPTVLAGPGSQLSRVEAAYLLVSLSRCLCKNCR